MTTAAERWREMLEARRGSFGDRDRSGFWEQAAGRFAFSIGRQRDRFLDFLEPWLEPRRTLIDVGAGTGRHAAPLADRLEWVTAVEPEEAMRRLIPERPNMTVVASTWADAEVAPADLVISCHVLYAVAEPAPFLEKMNALARERAFVALREGPNRHPADRLADRPPEPGLSEAVEVLRELGVEPEVERWTVPVEFAWADLEAARADWRLRGWEGEPEGLREAEDGSLRYDAGEQVTGVAHWKPRS